MDGFKSPSVTAILKRSAKLYPDNICTIDGEECKYKDTMLRVQCFAQGLNKEAGVKRDERIAILSMNCSQYFEVFFACAWAGAIVVPLNIRLAPSEIIEQCNDCECAVIIVDEAFQRFIPKIANAIPSLRKIVKIGKSGQQFKESLNYEEMIQRNNGGEDALRGGDDVFGIFYTGGTTGKPKGVQLSHQNIFVNALGHVGMLQFKDQNRYLHSAPMFHMADNSSTFAITMVGGSHAFIPKFVPEEMLKAISRWQVTNVMMVPSMIALLLELPNHADYDCRSLSHIMYGASPMPDALLAPAMKKFPNAKFSQGYGMTETSPAICCLSPDFHVVGHPKLRSVGRPVSWAEVRIVDRNDTEVDRGVVGEIVTRGPHVMLGYWQMKEQTSKTINRSGWLHTGDAGYMDADGFVFIVDRIKDMIISGGENVYAAETENAVMTFPGVAMCAVVATPDKKLGELVTAVVVPKQGMNVLADELISHCRKTIAGYKCPRKVILRDQLPMSAAGKILKHKLREELQYHIHNPKL